MPVPKVRQVVYCEACGGACSLYDIECPYCGSEFVYEEVNGYKLPSARKNKYADKDAAALKTCVEMIMGHSMLYPDQMDIILRSVKPMIDHDYPYRYFLIETLMILRHYRDICLEKGKETRDAYLEMLKRVEAVYFSLIH